MLEYDKRESSSTVFVCLSSRFDDDGNVDVVDCVIPVARTDLEGSEFSNFNRRVEVTPAGGLIVEDATVSDCAVIFRGLRFSTFNFFFNG